jgi:HSP20 family protein
MTLVRFKNGNRISHYPAFDKAFGLSNIFNDSFEKFWSDEELNCMHSENIRERSTDFKIDLAAPAMDKKDFTIEIDEQVLTISGTRKEEELEENDKITRREFHYGSFRRSFTLPDTADSEKVGASYKDGVLSVVIAKKTEELPKGKKQIVIE